MLLLHGAASNGSRWWRFTENTRLNQQHQLLRPDLRGHGASIWRGPATMEHWADDLADLLDVEELPGAVLVGHCLGANLAIHFAARYPDRVFGLVLVEPMLRSALLGSLARLKPLVPLLRLLVLVTQVCNRLGLYRRRFPELDLKTLDQKYAKVLAGPGGTTALRARYASPRHDIRLLPFAQYLENLLQVLRPVPLAQVRCPILALLSRGRYMADPGRTEAELAALPDLRIQTLAAEHWIPTEQPEAMREEVEAFVDTLV